MCPLCPVKVDVKTKRHFDGQGDLYSYRSSISFGLATLQLNTFLADWEDSIRFRPRLMRAISMKPWSLGLAGWESHLGHLWNVLIFPLNLSILRCPVRNLEIAVCSSLGRQTEDRREDLEAMGAVIYIFRDRLQDSTAVSKPRLPSKMTMSQLTTIRQQSRSSRRKRKDLKLLRTEFQDSGGILDRSTSNPCQQDVSNIRRSYKRRAIQHFLTKSDISSGKNNTKGNRRPIRRQHLNRSTNRKRSCDHLSTNQKETESWCKIEKEEWAVVHSLSPSSDLVLFSSFLSSNPVAFHFQTPSRVLIIPNCMLQLPLKRLRFNQISPFASNNKKFRNDIATDRLSRQDKEMELNQDQDIMELNQDPIGVKSDGPTETTTEGRQEVRETGETTAPLADAVNQLSALLTRVKISDGAESAIPPFDGTYNATQFFQAFDRKMEDASMGEQEKLLRLPNYLARQPLELFRKLRLADRSYFQVRQILLDLYPESSEASFAKYFAMKLTGQANLETYYREKTAMGLQLGLPQEVILETLTEGLPFNDQRLVRVVPPENLGEWFRLVQRIHGPSVPTTRPREDQPPPMSGPYHSTPRRPGAWNAPLPPSNCKFCGARHWHSECRRRPVPTTHEKVRTVQTVPKSPVPIPQQPSDHTPLHNSHMTNPHNELDTHTNTQQNPLPHAYYNTTPNTHYTPQFTTLLQRYTHIFSQDKFNVPCLRIPPVKIPTNSEKIITIRPYRVPICDQQEIRNQIQQMLENGIIEQSFSPFSSPVTLVTKRDKTKRFCIDYRKVNELISSDVHPLPRIEDILDRLAQAKYFSTADISSAYWQVPIHPDSRPLLAFATFEGLYQPTRLPFGLKTSPQIYERAISQVLQRHGLDCVAHYFDDFIIYSNTLEEHQNHLRQFFAFCEAEKLQLNFAKCEFFKQSINFLGYTITAGTITPLTRNTDIIHAIKQPHNRKTLQSFLGAVNVYNKFIPEYARLRAPLNNLLKKDVVWNWNEACQEAFIDLKGNLTQHPILHLYKEGLPCQVYCDASTLGIAGILKQVHPDGNVYPAQYFSRTLRPHEKNYSISELECLAIVESVEKFRIYLMGRKFTIFSDHHALQWLKTIKNPSGRLFRWSLRLSSYEYEVRYIKGKLQYEADLLSRNPFCGFLDATLIKTHQPPPSKESTLTIDRNGLHTVSRKGVTKIILPKPLIQQLLQTVHTQYNHPGISQMSRIISTQYYWQVGPTYGELSQPPESKEPFDLLSLDTIAGFAKYGNTKIYLHVVVDHFSRYAWAFPSKSTSTTTYQQSPPAFTSPKFRSFLLNRNIHPLITTSNNPQANGLCERLNATLTGKLRLLHLENPKVAWTKLVKKVTLIYNKTPHSTTGFPPIYLMFGILPPEISNHNTPYPDIDKARKIAHTRTQNKHLQDKNIYDQRHKQPHFEVGDLVLVKLYHHPNTGKLAPYFTGPHTILEIISPNVVRIDRPNQPLQRDTDTIHVNKLKLYTEKIRYISPPAVSTYHIKHNPNYTFPFKHLTPELFPTELLRFKPTSSEPFRHLDPAIFATRRFASLFPDVKNCKPDNQLNHITPLPKDIKQENCEPTNHSNSTIKKDVSNIRRSYKRRAIQHFLTKSDISSGKNNTKGNRRPIRRQHLNRSTNRKRSCDHLSTNQKETESWCKIEKEEWAVVHSLSPSSDLVVISLSTRSLVHEAFSIIGRQPDLQAWIFGTGLEDDELAILASAKSRIYRYFVQVGLGEAIEDPSSPGRGFSRARRTNASILSQLSNSEDDRLLRRVQRNLYEILRSHHATQGNGVHHTDRKDVWVTHTWTPADTLRGPIKGTHWLNDLRDVLFGPYKVTRSDVTYEVVEPLDRTRQKRGLVHILRMNLSREGLSKPLVLDRHDPGDQDKWWYPHSVCGTCYQGLLQWKSGKSKGMPFGVPMVWREPKNHHGDCYFCVCKITGLNSKKKQTNFYPDIPSARQPIPHDLENPIPIPKTVQESYIKKDDQHTAFADAHQLEDLVFISNESGIPHLFANKIATNIYLK
ncbi:hypothetical protein LAZ67_15001145 [Cordylochernes scorpioides]|uniref:Reverse transcriptase n=1 Tax=Cordylochernes scorpioides TaxID=51811 RepID=A0ABY6L8K2_9ARAC|nr:hypothetical protein LAZ67_15001145 [Cordylochernes scorpioides]